MKTVTKIVGMAMGVLVWTGFMLGAFVTIAMLTGNAPNATAWNAALPVLVGFAAAAVLFAVFMACVAAVLFAQNLHRRRALARR